MKVLFIETTTQKKITIDAHVRNCIILNKFLNNNNIESFIAYSDNLHKFLNKKYDCIIISYSSFYANFKDAVTIINNNPDAKLFWLTNEYNIVPNSSIMKCFKERGATCIANYEENQKIKGFTDFVSINLNVLFFNKNIKKLNKKYNCIYYGTFRKDRLIYFQKYFQNKDIYLSTSKKNMKKFKINNCNPKYIDKISFKKGQETLKLFKYSLYIEDKHIHKNFNNLANRFYESLSSEAVILFDKSCINTLEKSELNDYEDFIINSLEDIKNRNYEEDIKKQKKWVPLIENEKEKVLYQFLKIIVGD